MLVDGNWDVENCVRGTLRSPLPGTLIAQSKSYTLSEKD
jgi:hypothetical protein